MQQKADYVSLECHTDGDVMYPKSGITIYDEKIHNYEDVLETEIAWLNETENPEYEIHIYKLHKIVKPKRVITEIVILDVDETCEPIKEPEIEI